MPTSTSGQPSQAHTHPYRTLLASFAAWKLFLFAIALGSSLVGDAYDTSASLVVEVVGNSTKSSNDVPSLTGSFGSRFISRLTSWDAIYFTSVARRGYRFEQEWAFGGALPVVVRGVIKALQHLNFLSAAPPPSAVREALVGILVANAAHLLSALVLYRLGHLVWRHNQTLALVAALLHVLSPAGLFLSAPYAESSCALFTFAGYLAFALSCRAESRPLVRDLYVVAAGVLFGLATAFRSNGILNGIPFAWAVLRCLPNLPRRPVDTVRRLAALGVGGVCVAAGSVGPQAVAWFRFCSGASGGEVRPWCGGYLPSIYTFVQEHYWNVGFLRYWTVSNLPLFLLAAPMLVVMLKSGLGYLTVPQLPAAGKPAETSRLSSLVQSAAAAQVLLALLAVTTYHVQIITRISSGYPLWHWWLAEKLIRGDKSASRLVMFILIYASVQGALFASFLPPA